MIPAALSLAAVLSVAAAAAAPAPASSPPMDYVEFVVHDLARTKAFYHAIFGWTFIDYGPGYSSFTDNGLGGGFTTEGTPMPGGPLIVFHVDHLKAALDRAKAAGAIIVKPIYAFPGGRRFQFKDPDNYEIAAWVQE